MTPAIRGIEKGTVIPPKEGWEERTYYIVEVAYSKGNLIHKTIFYSGFLSSGKPSGYNCILSPTNDGKYNINDLYYLKVIRKLVDNSLN